MWSSVGIAMALAVFYLAYYWQTTNITPTPTPTPTTTTTTKSSPSPPIPTTSPNTMPTLEELEWGLRYMPMKRKVVSLPAERKGKNWPVVWMAPFLTNSGYGSEAVSYMGALEGRRPGSIVSVHHGDLVTQGYFPGLPADDRFALMVQSYRTAELPISVCHGEPKTWHPNYWSTENDRCPTRDSIFNIGRTMAETDRLPLGWKYHCNLMDQIWVPTQFSREVFTKSGVEPSKLRVIPESVDVVLFDSTSTKPMDLPGLYESRFKFLSIFKWEERKGWSILIKAFLREFSLEERVVLYIKTEDFYGPGLSPENQMKNLVEQEIRESGLDEAKLPKIHILDTFIPTSAMPKLYKSVDVYVIPSRGEGWGRTHVEAMAMSLPIIATNWSGPTEYMTPQNSYPLKVEKLVPMTKEGDPLLHRLWAEPSLKHLRELMRHVVKNPYEAKEKGKKARHDMISKYNQNIIASIIDAELKIIELELPVTYQD